MRHCENILMQARMDLVSQTFSGESGIYPLRAPLVPANRTSARALKPGRSARRRLTNAGRNKTSNYAASDMHAIRARHT